MYPSAEKHRHMQGNDICLLAPAVIHNGYIAANAGKIGMIASEMRPTVSTCHAITAFRRP